MIDPEKFQQTVIEWQNAMLSLCESVYKINEELYDFAFAIYKLYGCPYGKSHEGLKLWLVMITTNTRTTLRKGGTDMSQWSEPYKETIIVDLKDGRDLKVIKTLCNLLNSAPFQKPTVGAEILATVCLEMHFRGPFMNEEIDRVKEGLIEVGKNPSIKIN